MSSVTVAADGLANLPDSATLEHRWSGLDAVLVVVAAGVVPAAMFFAVYVFGGVVPWLDEWDWAGSVIAVQHGAGSYINLYTIPVSVVEALWNQHNEHRVFVPGVVAIVLSLSGGWSPKREELFSVAVVALQLALIWRMLRATVPANTLAPAFAATALIVFSLSQYENWTWGYQMTWFIGTSLAVASVFLLTREDLSRARVTGALAASIASAYSAAFGLMSPVVGFAILIARRDASRRSRVLWAVWTFVALFVYFRGYRFGLDSSHVAGRMHAASEFPAYVQYVLLYLGAPLGNWNGLELSAAFGGLGILVYAVGVVRYLRLRRDRGPYAGRYLPWLGIASFAVFNALFTSFGRLEWGPLSAVQSRYTTVTVTFWASVVALTVVFVNDGWWRGLPLRRGGRVALGAAAAALFAASFYQSELRGFALMAATHTTMDNGMRAIANLAHASDAQLYDIYPPDVNIPRVGIKLLTLAGIGPLATTPQRAFEGRGDEPAFGRLYTFAYQGRDGIASVTGPVPRGEPLVVTGWVCDSVTLKPGQSVVALVDGKETRESARYGLSTPEVAAGYFLENLESVGFEMRVDTRTVTPGRHNFEIGLRTRGNPFLHHLYASQRVLDIAGAPEASSGSR